MWVNGNRITSRPKETIMLKYLIPIALVTLPVPQLVQAQSAGAAVQASAPAERARWGVAGESRNDFVRASRDAATGPRRSERFGAISADRIDARQARQSNAIARGIESGRLTPREAGRLRAEQARIERHEQRARADGNFTLRERARINRELDRSRRHILRDLRDGQRLGGYEYGRRFGSLQGWERGYGFGQRGPGRYVGWRGDGRHFWR
jgi:hypothetical protein